jgi:hypothetical protein
MVVSPLVAGVAVAGAAAGVAFCAFMAMGLMARRNIAKEKILFLIQLD